MRTTFLGALVLVGVWAAWLPACKSGSGAAAPDASGTGGGAGTRGGAGAGGGGAGSGGITGSGGVAGGMAVRDCLPACVVALRGACERPAVDGGTCFAGPGGHCYANGVRETMTFADGGQLNVYTKPDGQTICYQVFSESGGISHFQTPSGQEIAVARYGADGGYEVTCDGTTVVVNLADPGCATQNSTNCTAGDAGECP